MKPTTKFSGTYFLLCATFVLSLFSRCQDSTGLPNATYSPDKKIKVIFDIQNGIPGYSVYYQSGQVVGPSALGLEMNSPFEGGFEIVTTLESSFDEWWKPVYGEYEKIHNHYNSFEIKLREIGKRHRLLNIVFRTYNEGVAFRYVIPKQEDSTVWQINKELSTFKFVKGSQAYPIYRTEQTYSGEPVEIEQIDSGAFLPFTIRLQNGFASLLEANVFNYPNMCLDKSPEGGIVSRIYGTAEIFPPFSFPWRAILLAADERKLIENESMILNLNPPCALGETSWIKAGKTISNEGSVGLKTDKLKKVVDFASENGFKYLQLDWGWYGTEVKWSDDQIKSFKQIMPEKFKNSGWETNAQANPFVVGKGYVPYGWDERWKNSYTYVDLDIHELVSYAKNKGVGICLYVEAGHTLRSYDMDSLFSKYESWGLAGLKPGFVKHGTQENTNWIQTMVELAAKHHLLLCIHDARIPDGTTRTYPNLIINEGGGGQEGNHPVVHDVMLPFCRCLAGPFDYTPAIYTRGRSNAHMLSFLVTYYGPAQTIRGGYTAWNNDGKPGKGGEEIEFLRRVPATWDDTKVLSAKIGHHIIAARRSGNSWFVGGMTGDKALDEKLPLSFLELGKTYTATIFKDDSSGFSEGFCPAKKEILTVNSKSELSVNMLASGGFVAIFDPTK